MNLNASGPRLLVLSGPLEGNVVPLKEGESSIGRHRSNALTLPTVAVSRHHAAIINLDSACILRDLGSRHGTQVNAAKVQEHTLRHGDLISICGSILLFQVCESRPADDHSPLCFDDKLVLTDSTVAFEAPSISDPEWENRLGDLLEPRASPQEKGQQQRLLNILLRIGSTLGTFQNLQDLAHRLLRLALEAVPAQRAALLLARPGDDTFEPCFTHDPTGQESSPFSVSRTATLRVQLHQKALFSNDVSTLAELHSAKSLEGARVGSLLCVPLIMAAPQASPGHMVTSEATNGSEEPPKQASTRSLGVLYLDAPESGYHFSDTDLKAMTMFAGIAAPAVANLQNWLWTNGERKRLQAEKLDHDLVGESSAMVSVLDLVARVARSEATILLRGESGTGKELVAQAIHRGGVRRDRPFVAINCATLSETLLESELFGHEKGAFTGAVSRKLGKIEMAATGTLFLDEIGELPQQLQAKLLRVLQEREFERVGGTRPIRADVRVIAATNRDLESAMKGGTFREDLYFRLNVITINLPPLRDRRTDIPLLVAHFAALHASRLGCPTPDFSAATRRLLSSYSWPGNVRELSNAVERALVLSSSTVILPEDLPEAILEAASPEENPALSLETGYHAALRAAKKRLILEAVEQAEGKITEAAKVLDLHPNYLHRLIRNLELRPLLP